MTQPSLCSRIATSILALALVSLGNAKALNAQDISGGASVLLASADVEARLGKGIFTSPQNVAHAPKRLEKKIVARTVRPAAHAQRQTTASSRQETPRTETRPPRRTDRKPPLTAVTKPAPAQPSKPLVTAETLNKQGDVYFDAGQYEKAAESYQQAIRLEPEYAE